MEDDTDRPDGTPAAWQGTLGEFLRGKPGLRTLDGDESIRRRLALLDDRTLFDGSALQAAVGAGHVSEDTLPVLLAAVELRHLSEPFEDVEGASTSDAIRRTREGLAAAAKVVDSDWPGTGVMEGKTDPDMEAFETVGVRLAEMEDRARTAEETIHEAGFAFKRTDGRLKDGKKQALRVCVEVLLADRDDLDDLSPDRRALRKELAGELAPLFPGTRLDAAESRGILKNTIRNALDELRGSTGDG